MPYRPFKNQSESFSAIYKINRSSKIKYWVLGLFIFALCVLFLPWTQNIKSKGIITTLSQEQRPQNVNSPIPGRIVKWWVREGDFVKKGDTILQIAEIKEDYMDPNLVGRTREQVEAKKQSIDLYQGKAATATSQMSALAMGRQLKLEQLNNKLDQLDYKLLGEKAENTAAENEKVLKQNQLERQQKMYDEGLVSQTELQKRLIDYQNAAAKKVVSDNKLAQTKQEVANTRIELSGVEQEYSEKISKTQGDRLASLSEAAAGMGEVAKLQNQVANYVIRNGQYIILAPQDGQIVQASKSGIGEILKDGEKLMMIVPTKLDYAVEMFVRPLDLPLINRGQKVRFMFDGFPAIVFSGWPENSYGTFGGKIVAIESAIGANGLFRVLVAEDATDRPWPSQLKIGAGAQCITLLKDVAIWYELWRNINGFPPDYYKVNQPENKGK